MKKHPESYHDGAADERDAIRKKINRMLQDVSRDLDDLTALRDWIDLRSERYKKRAGGL